MGSSITLFHYHSTVFLLFISSILFFSLLNSYSITNARHHHITPSITVSVCIDDCYSLHYISCLSGCRWSMFGKQENKTTLMVQQLNAWSEKHSNYNICNDKMTKRLNEPYHFHDIWSINIIMNGMVAVAATFNTIFVRFRHTFFWCMVWVLCVCVCVCYNKFNCVRFGF